MEYGWDGRRGINVKRDDGWIDLEDGFIMTSTLGDLPVQEDGSAKHGAS